METAINPIFEIAEYAFHNCEFSKALDHLSSLAPEPRVIGLQLAVLNEMDKTSEAFKLSTRAVQQYPFSGAIHYEHAISAYADKQPMKIIEKAFHESVELGELRGSWGLAFLAFVNGDHDKALSYLDSVASDQPQVEQVRLLKVFQIALIAKNVKVARYSLDQCSELLKSRPSLLRRFWFELCEVRYCRAIGEFTRGRENLSRLMLSLSQEKMPRLYRNCAQVAEYLNAEDAGNYIIVPDEKAAQPLPDLRSINRKPVLNSMYQYLLTCGDHGASKEAIIEKVWEENYNPVIHDDRVYKTVGRLRKLLGDNLEAPQFLIQRGRQYVLQPQKERINP